MIGHSVVRRKISLLIPLTFSLEVQKRKQSLNGRIIKKKLEQPCCSNFLKVLLVAIFLEMMEKDIIEIKSAK